MRQLPGRPDIEQLRRQARELHHAAQAEDAAALRLLRRVSGKVSLSTAQLALARDYGFPSWRQLRDEVERRRAADELIAAQYADRPALRPVLDAVLAALPALGPVTVQARKTCVSLASPRRAFAAVQATTKSRVDLGLRIDHTQPSGRLLAAKNIASGTINLRIPLGGPDDVDGDVLNWLRRAYDESMAPVKRRPARRPAPVAGTMTVLIDGFDLPGLTCHPEPDGTVHRSVHVALTGHDQSRPHLELPGRGGARAVEPVPGDAPSARWEVPVTVRRGDDGFDFSGPFVRGARDDRHLGLAWGDVPGDGTLRLFRGAKLRLVDVEPRLVEAAMRPGHRLVTRVRLTDPRGNPICARVSPPFIEWAAEQCG